MALPRMLSYGCHCAALTAHHAQHGAVEVEPLYGQDCSCCHVSDWHHTSALRQAAAAGAAAAVAAVSLSIDCLAAEIC